MNADGARRVDRAGLVIAAMLLATAGVILWDMSRLQITSVYGLGPKAMPIVVAAGLALLSLGNLMMALRGELPARESADPRAILMILGGLVALIALIGLGGGFIPATAILFATTAAAFGRRAFLTDLAIGLVLGLVVYLMFDKLLTLSLPAGPLERLF
ncbi:MAG: putative tricarboxylic transport rane protein [Alphaproteobacteria bacterium]|jgi:putative tricarboxylic transport membrane protein|nr:putative tricarboxylic transport rane protein [Alphaproteobacteria bacterium]